MLTLGVVCRLLNILTVVLIVWSFVEHIVYSTPDSMLVRQVLVATCVLVAAHIISVLRTVFPTKILGVALTAVSGLAVVLTETEAANLAVTSSTVLLVVPVVIAAAVISPGATMVTWLVVSVAFGALSYIARGYLPFYPLIGLFFISFVVYVTVKRLDHLVRMISAERDLLNGAVSVITKYEAASTEALWWNLENVSPHQHSAKETPAEH